MKNAEIRFSFPREGAAVAYRVFHESFFSHPPFFNCDMELTQDQKDFQMTRSSFVLSEEISPLKEEDGFEHNKSFSIWKKVSNRGEYRQLRNSGVSVSIFDITESLDGRRTYTARMPFFHKCRIEDPQTFYYHTLVFWTSGLYFCYLLFS